jgi:uncharacterized DUF497 family protein
VGVIFEWDPLKAIANLQMHFVSFEEASTTFADPLSSTIHDPNHSNQEDRYILMGYSLYHRLIVVAFTERSHKIRIISARLATSHERKEYENA